MRSCYFFIILIALLLSKGDSHNDCVYTLYVKTGSAVKAGTDSKISITLGDSAGRSVWVRDLSSWGLMAPNHDYYERDNLDIFSGRGPCIGAPVCRINVTSDGSGWNSSWYCRHIEVTSTGPQRTCGQSVFYVDQWLSDHVPPYQLTAIIDGCKIRGGPSVQRIRSGQFVVGRSDSQ